MPVSGVDNLRPKQNGTVKSYSETRVLSKLKWEIFTPRYLWYID